ncbi:unnamed protein product [Allacma fusca]|uniref:G-protein coupled receptors family 1 profile domain-containing protein n=1 Tax=Allacma fusca TaxID=39272 RepID=A0A8J2KRS8_9HEXA|nr:unnamed protein product [Allacma fusca]
MLVLSLLDMTLKLHRCASLIINIKVHKSFMTDKKVVALLGFAWIGPISVMFLYFGFGTIAGGEIMRWECTNYYFQNDSTWKIITVFVFSISLVLLALMNWQSCHLITKLQQSYIGQKLFDYDHYESNTSQFQWNLQYLRRTSHGIVIWYLIGWGPFCLAYAVSSADNSNVPNDTRLVVSLVARSMIILKTLTSPFLYAMKFRVIRLRSKCLVISSAIYRIAITYACSVQDANK